MQECTLDYYKGAIFKSTDVEMHECMLDYYEGAIFYIYRCRNARMYARLLQRSHFLYLQM